MYTIFKVCTQVSDFETVICNNCNEDLEFSLHLKVVTRLVFHSPKESKSFLYGKWEFGRTKVGVSPGQSPGSLKARK